MPRIVPLSQDILEDPDFDSLSHAAQRAWFLLRLDYRVGLSGMGRIAPTKLREALGVEAHHAEEIVGELCRKRWVRWDPETGLLWFAGAYAREPNNRSCRTAALREIRRLPASSFQKAWLELYADRWEADGVTAREKDQLREVAAWAGFRPRDGTGTLPLPFVDRSGTVTRASVPVPVPVPVSENGDSR